jgi:hypothetical protein
VYIFSALVATTPAGFDAHVISFSLDWTDNPEVSLSGLVLLPARSEKGAVSTVAWWNCLIEQASLHQNKAC